MAGSDQVKPANSGVKLTWDDFVHFPDDGKRHELIGGEHYVMPPPNLRHQAISRNLLFLIQSFLQTHPIGRVYCAPLDVILSQFDVVEPDLLYVSNERREELLSGQWVTGAPDLVVEIGSPSNRRHDETIKRRLYERFAVAEYWVVDPELDAIKVYRRTGERYERVAELMLEDDDVLTTPLLPGLEMTLARIFCD
jgi:Uma2 family endonuclease